MRIKFYVMKFHKRRILFSFSDMSMSYRASVVKVPDYSSSSFSTEGFSVYKNTQSGKWILISFRSCANLNNNLYDKPGHHMPRARKKSGAKLFKRWITLSTG